MNLLVRLSYINVIYIFPNKVPAAQRTKRIKRKFKYFFNNKIRLENYIRFRRAIKD